MKLVLEKTRAVPVETERLRALRRDGGFFVLGQRTRVRVTGADRLRYLNGQLSNDLRRLVPGEAMPALLLTAKGKLCADVFVWIDEESLVVEGDVSLEEQLDGPVEHHAEAGREGRQLEHVNGLPQEPRRKAGELEPTKIGHGCVTAQRHHFAEQTEVERPARAPGELRDELLAERASLAKGHLRSRRVELAGVRITLRGVVPIRLDVTKPVRTSTGDA